MRNLFARRIADDDVRARIVGGVEPKVVWLGDFEGQIVVVTRRAADQNFVTVR
jgi:hypothetical protein